MDINRINKVISYMRSSISSVKQTDAVSGGIIEKTALDNCAVKNIDNTVIKEDYGAERYLINNPNMLYRYVNKRFISKNTFKVNKAAYPEAAKKYGYRNSTKKNCFEESYI